MFILPISASMSQNRPSYIFENQPSQKTQLVELIESRRKQRLILDPSVTGQPV